MLPWIKRWRDWAMDNLWPLSRLGPQPQALHYSYEKAGLTIADQPIPWNAEAVVVEARLRLLPSAARRKDDFQLRVPGQELFPAENVRRAEDHDAHRITFRLPPPPGSVTAELLWRGHARGQLTLPVLSREEFVQGLRLQMPTVFVRLGDESVACRTFVASQGKGLLASAVVASPTSLVPLLDLDLQVEFRNERDGIVSRVPARLCSSQLAGRQALISVVPGKLPRRMGTWTVLWLLGDRELASGQLKAIGQRTFQRSLRVSATRYVMQDGTGTIRVGRQPPSAEKMERVGPCFLVSSGEPGMAGLCSVQVRAQVADSVRPPLLWEQDVLLTDGPTMIAPGTLDAGDLAQASGFELLVKGQVLGVLPLRPAPAATFTSEGGYKPPPEFSWSAAAEDELNERLARLIENNAGR